MRPMTIPDPTRCPEEIALSLRNYEKLGVPTGGFLEAVLSNDLREAIARADVYNCAALPHIVNFCYAHLNANCWGSKEKVKAHLEKKRQEIREALEKQKGGES